jgi:ABC-2 type transport system ATP-binding protein
MRQFLSPVRPADSYSVALVILATGGNVQPIISISGLNKTYESGFQALRHIDLTIDRGEIFALLGPNGAGKTTLISIVCGLVNASAGEVRVDGHDIVRDYRAARSTIGLVPQELTNNMFDTVWATLRLSRGLFGKPRDDAHLERVLRDLSLWEKRHDRIMSLSGGMKRRVLIAKALSHEPRVLFLDEPTAGVDVELRREMWEMVRRLREQGVTIILTTHYIEEAEEMADRIAVIRRGELILVEEKHELMRKLGTKQLSIQLPRPLPALPQMLNGLPLTLSADGYTLIYTYDAAWEQSGISELLATLAQLGIDFKDLRSSQSSLEDIFVELVGRPASAPVAPAEAVHE